MKVEQTKKFADLSSEIEMYESQLISINHVINNRSVVAAGMIADIRDNGTVVLKTSGVNEYHSHAISTKDSISILNIIRISIKDSLALAIKNRNEYVKNYSESDN